MVDEISEKVNESFFAYSWYLDHTQKDTTLIRIYGLNKKNENVCVVVSNFTPYVYVELPENVEWNQSKAQMVANKIDEILGEKKPLIKQLMFKKRLYYANIARDEKTEKLEKRKFPYLFCSFACIADIEALRVKLRRPLNILGIGNLALKVHEYNARPILQMTSLRKIPAAGWIKFQGRVVQEKTTVCKYEYNVSWKALSPEENNKIARPLIMGYDIEVNSSVKNSMPNADRPNDKIFQISCVFKRQGDSPEKSEKILLSLGEPNQEITGEDVEIRMYGSEYELLVGFCDLVRERQPNLAMGHNIFRFDVPYMIERAGKLLCIDTFERQSFAKYVRPIVQTIKWSSSAYGNQDFRFIDVEGIIFVDILPLVQRDYKLTNYKLKTIAEHFLKNQTKDPLDAHGIFKCYKIGMEGGAKGAKAMGIVGKYCVQDSNLVVNIFEKMTAWVGLCEMSAITSVPIFSLFTQGQQLKVFSQVYRKATHENIVVETDGYITKEDDHYQGATVFPPKAGLYEKVVPFDFNSLYPTTIIAYNISWDTLVVDDKIPDSDCHVMEWEDHVGCAHDPKEIEKKRLADIVKKFDEETKKLRQKRDAAKKEKKEEYKILVAKKVEECRPFRQELSELKKTKPKYKMCTKRRFRWLKTPIGVLPEILKNLLDARKAAKEQLKIAKKQFEDEKNKKKKQELEGLIEVLDQRQNALKISANSAYGALGVSKGKLPFMPGAMCTTYKGRMAVQLAARLVQEEFKGILIYGDTDSNYVSFPHLETAQECWDYSIYVAAEISKKFPWPMKLAFEEIIYWKFLLIAKKRYICRYCGPDGKLGEEIKKKGVLLQRRDNCQFIRTVYEDVVMSIFDQENPLKILYKIIVYIRKLLARAYDISFFEISKSVKDMEPLQEISETIGPVQTEEEGKKVYKIGDYKIRKDWILSEDPLVRSKQLEKKDAENEKEYYLLCMPAQAQLAEKLRKRGELVPAGTRLEYVITTLGGINAKQSVKIDSTEYFKKHSRSLSIDYLYYLSQLTTPLDQILDILLKGKKIKGKIFKGGFVESIYKTRIAYMKVMEELKSLVSPKIVVRD